MKSNAIKWIFGILLVGGLIASVTVLMVVKYSKNTTWVPKPLESDYSKKPVICTTVGQVDADRETPWISCAERCPTRISMKTTAQNIMVDVRNKGISIRFENCEAQGFISCIPPKPFWCYKGDCETMNGEYNCLTDADPTSGTVYGAKCQDISSTHHCKFTELNKDTKGCHKIKACLYLNGLYQCNTGFCNQANATDCTRDCDQINTKGKSVLIRQGNNIYTAKCKRAVNVRTGEQIWPLNTQKHLPLLIYCAGPMPLSEDADFRNPVLTDCFNGTIIDSKIFGDRTTDLDLRRIHSETIEKNIMANADAEEGSESDIDHGLIGPTESDLMIFRNTRLYINYNGCVDAENGCQQFYSDFGVPNSYGMVAAAQPPPYECYHSPSSSFGALLKIRA